MNVIALFEPFIGAVWKVRTLKGISPCTKLTISWKKTNLQDHLLSLKDSRLNSWHERCQEVPLIAPVITRLGLYSTASSFLLKDSLTGFIDSISYMTSVESKSGLSKHLYAVNKLFLERIIESLFIILMILLLVFILSSMCWLKLTLRSRLYFVVIKSQRLMQNIITFIRKHTSTTCFVGSGLNKIFHWYLH